MVRERRREGQLVDDKAKELWVYLQRLYEPGSDVNFWRFSAHYPKTTWIYYDSCEVHQVATEKGVDAFMFAEKEYPLKVGTLSVMRSSGVSVYSESEKANALFVRTQEQCDSEIRALKSKPKSLKASS